ncbi:hypothetical protein HYT01_01790 [Candidatus Giovannonibacteria bacterium]|nr:hypothetical protein [Candidatus Giovannonibacteria bacterium]
MSEALKKFKDELEKVNSVAVVSGKSKSAPHALSSAILHSAFLKFGKKSHLQPTENAENVRKFTEAVVKNLENLPKPENILIKLDTKKIPVSELKYEKEGDILKIILKGADSLNASDISIEKESAPVDLLLIVDPEEKELEKILALIPHREVVKLSAKEKSMAAKISDVLTALFDEIPEEFVNALWALSEIEEKTSENELKENLDLKRSLLEKKIDSGVIMRAKEILLGKNFWKLLGRAMARSEFEKNTETLWSFIPKGDFLKTGQSPEAAPELFREMKNIRPEAGFFALLWENTSDPKAVEALIGGRDINKLQKLASSLGTSLSSPYFIAKGFLTFSEAELKIRSAMQRTFLNSPENL